MKSANWVMQGKRGCHYVLQDCWRESARHVKVWITLLLHSFVAHTYLCSISVGFGEVLRKTETEHIRNQASVSCQDTGWKVFGGPSLCAAQPGRRPTTHNLLFYMVTHKSLHVFNWEYVHAVKIANLRREVKKAETQQRLHRASRPSVPSKTYS